MTLPPMMDEGDVRKMEPHEYNMRVWADKQAIEVINRQKARIRELEAALRQARQFLPKEQWIGGIENGYSRPSSGAMLTTINVIDDLLGSALETEGDANG